MNLAEYLEDLDPKLAANIERALDAVRGEFEQKIAATVQDAVSAAAEDAAAREAATAQQPERATPSSTVVSLDAADELRLAALDIDTAKSQSEILEALTRGILRFSSRVAIFVNRGQAVQGWSASGFGDADATIREVSLSHELPFPTGAGLGEGAVALSAEDCALVCDAIGAEPPSMGLLLPFVLGSQIVGTVYCDRRSDEAFSVSALQLLTYVAGQTLETLPVRKRDATATLTLARGSAPSDAAAEAPVETTSPQPESTPEPEPAPEPEPVAGADAGAEAAPAQSPPEAPDQPASEPRQEEPSTWGAPAAEIAAEPEAVAPIDEEGTRPGTLEAAPTPAIEPAPAPEASAPTPASAPPAAESAPPADDHVDAAADPAVNLSSTQVAPPDDLQGPGWAFTGGGDPGDASSETEHEEAQRLARLLVTEIKLYNEEAVEQGRRDGDVYSRLQEDIDRSRQIFEDRIDPGVRSENDYFKQALVRILAGGDPSLLGI